MPSYYVAFWNVENLFDVAFIHEAHRALRFSNAIALVMLFLGGYYLCGHA